MLGCLKLVALALPPGMTPEVLTGILSVSKSSTVQFSGPLRPPEMLRLYDAVLPGSADRIIRMAEKEEVHRHGLESSVVRSEILKSYAGTACGRIVALTGMGISGYLLNEGHTIGGSIFAGVPLTGLVTVYVVGSNHRRKERETKARILTGTDQDKQKISK
jgi:uncharacterized membrane protein